jgi:hypothetical protein
MDLLLGKVTLRRWRSGGPQVSRCGHSSWAQPSDDGHALWDLHAQWCYRVLVWSRVQVQREENGPLTMGCWWDPDVRWRTRRFGMLLLFEMHFYIKMLEKNVAHTIFTS